MRWDDSVDWIKQQVWACLARGVAEASAPARRPVLATIGQTGGPEARIVVLRGADPDAGTCVMHTDALSEKCAELAANPNAAMHVWDPSLALQIRLTGTVEQTPGTDVDWAATPEVSRGNYGTEPTPATPIDAFGAFVRVPDQARLTILTFQAERLDAVVLADDVHRRAIYSRSDRWRGQWVAP